MPVNSPALKLDRWLADALPGDMLKDFYTRGMRRVAEHTPFKGSGVVRTRYGFDITTDRLDAVKWCLHYFGVWEPQISEAWKRILPTGGTVLDIGGNIGYSALLAAKLVGPAGRVLTFEPSPKVFAQLMRNIALNQFGQVEAICAAVSDHTGTAQFHLMGDNDQGLGSLCPLDGAVRTETVELITFNEIAAMVNTQKIDLIKIDVEGAEASVIAGMVKHELSPTCVIFIEVSPEETATELLAPLVQLGFHARKIDNEYDTRFYRSAGQVRLSPLMEGSGVLQDVVLCRDLTMFSRMSD